MECAPGAGGLRAAAAPKRSCIGSFVLVAVVALPLSMFGDCLSDVCPVTSAYHSINGALHVNETLGLDEGLTYELPKSLMLVTGVFALCVGVASLLAGARLAQSLFALLLGALAGVVAVQHLAPELLLDQPHLEIELVTAWAVTSWWGNITDDPPVHSAEVKLPLDISCASALFACLCSTGVAMMSAPLMLRLNLCLVGMVAGVLAVRMASNFTPQLIGDTYKGEDEAAQAGPHYLGYPLLPFWNAAAPLALAFAALLIRGSTRTLVVVSSLIGSFCTIQGANALDRFRRGEYLVEAVEGNPKSNFLGGTEELVLFALGLLTQSIWCKPTSGPSRRSRQNSREYRQLYEEHPTS